MRKRGLITLQTVVLGAMTMAATTVVQSIDERIDRGVRLLEQDRLVEALGEFEAIIAAHPANAPAHLHRARVCYRAGQVDVALEQLEVAAGLAPRWVAPRLLAGQIELEAGDAVAAATSFRAALDVEPGASDLWVRYGDALAEADSVPEDRAIDAYRSAIAADPASELAWTALTYYLFNRMKIEETRSAVDEFLDHLPDNPYALLVVAELNMFDGDDRSALDSVQRALANLEARPAERAPPGWIRLDFLEVQARALLHLDRLVEAEHAARELVSLDPLNMEAVFLLGTILTRAGMAEGRDYLAAFQRLSDARAQQEMGFDYLDNGRPKAAAAAFERAAAIDDYDHRTYTGLGAAHLALGRAERAIEALSRARTLGATGPDWHRHWILALHAAGRDREARADWNNVRRNGGRLGPEVWAALSEHSGIC